MKKFEKMSFKVVLISLLTIFVYVSESSDVPDPSCVISEVITSSQSVILSALISTANNAVGYIIFTLQAESDVNVYLSGLQSCGFQENCLKIFVDQGNTGRTVITHKAGLGASSLISSVSNVTLDKNVNQTFWISWDSGNNNYIRFGYSDTINSSTQLISALFSSGMISGVNTILFESANGNGKLAIYTECTNSPTIFPTETPTKTPTNTPSLTPSVSPSDSPTRSPFEAPTAYPSITPTIMPTNNPSTTPTKAPTTTPTKSPTTTPSTTPTNAPSSTPTKSPSMYPSIPPTKYPSITPTITPTKASKYPSVNPTIYPSKMPVPNVTSVVDTPSPTMNPSMSLNEVTTKMPSESPTKTESGTYYVIYCAFLSI